MPNFEDETDPARFQGGARACALVAASDGLAAGASLPVAQVGTAVAKVSTSARGIAARKRI